MDKIKAFFKFLHSLVTDKEWDGDAAKCFGFLLIVVGLVGLWFGKSDFQWVILYGAGMVATGKWAEEKGK